MKNSSESEKNNNQQSLPPEEKLDIKTGLSAVASSPQKNIVILIIAAIAFSFLIYYLFFKNKQNPASETKKQMQKTQISAADLAAIPTVRPASQEPSIPAPTIPKLPDPPPLVAPTPPPPPPAPPVVETARIQTPSPANLQNIPAQGPILNKLKPKDKKNNRSIMLGGGSGQHLNTSVKNASNNISYYFNPSTTSASRNKVTTIGNLGYTIAQGKIIDVVLETSINTDLPGIVRGIISRNVYAESGKNILIHKGSRLIGSYSASLQLGQSRVSIIWNRIIRPDGIDMAINSPGIDKLGHSGVDGILDNKYFEMISNAVLLSVINIGLANAAQKITGAGSTTTTTTSTTGTSGSSSQTVTSGDPNSIAVQNATSSLNQNISKMMSDSMKVSPSIYIDQGTIVKVLVNQDIIFPASFSRGITVVQ